MEYYNSKNQRKDKFDKSKKYLEKNPHKASKRTKHHNPQREKNIKIYEDTIKHCLNMKKSQIPESSLYNVNDLNINLDLSKNAIFDTIYEVVNIDTFDMTMSYCEDGYEPMVLNMASDFKPGGGVAGGCTAQEECLFRRSNAFLTHPPKFYPLEENSVIYSPQVKIIKDSNYNLLSTENIETVGMLAVPAIRNPRIIKGEYKDNDLEIMTNKIESIFKIAIKQEHDSLILGALGCGAFNNPSNLVASIFRDMIDIYGKYFKKIGFAILVVRDSDLPNLETFKKIILDNIN